MTAHQESRPVSTGMDGLGVTSDCPASPLGRWVDARTGTAVTVVKIDDAVVWYTMAEWNGWLNCAKDVFLSVMCSEGGSE